MATAWVKSLQCKSTAYDDVLYHPKPIKLSSSKVPSPSCSSTSQALRDVVFLFPNPNPSSNKHHRNQSPAPPPPACKQPSAHRRTTTPRPKSRPKPKPDSRAPKIKSPLSPLSPAAVPAASFPTLTEIPAGHSSRRVVEIIFGSSWTDPTGAAARFPGRIEILFRVHNPARTAARFEEYRAAVKSRAAAADPRCAADGNEMMRFHCAPSLSSVAGGGGDGIYDAGVVRCAVESPAGGRGIRTFAGSGGAHESAGGGPGRRAMLVCRVIAGRIRSGSDPESAGESVCGSGSGELIVFDPRAVLPCFLIIYKL